MQTFKYQEQNKTKSILLITVYMGAWIIGASLYFGGFLQLADAVSNIGSAKLAGLLVSVLVLLPFFILMRFVYTTVIVEIDKEKISFQKKGEEAVMISFFEINKMIINAERLNTFHLYNKNGDLLWAILPIANNKNLLEEIPNAIAANVNFSKQATTKKFLNTQYISTTFLRTS